MHGISNKVLHDKITKWGLILSFVFSLFGIAYILVVYFSLPPLLPLFNQMPWGEKRLGIKFAIFLPVIVSLVFLSLNFLIMGRIYEKVPLLSRILSITTLLISILAFIFVIRTIYLLI